MNDKTCKCAILAHTDGSELTMEQFDTYEQAYDRMKSGHEEAREYMSIEQTGNKFDYYDEDIVDDETYVNEFDAKLTVAGEDPATMLWQIKLIK